MDNTTKWIEQDGIKTLVETMLKTMATEGYLPYLRQMITTEVNRATTSEGKINEDISSINDMIKIIENEVQNVISHMYPITVIECVNFNNNNEFQIDNYPSGYNKNNTIVVSTKVIYNNGDIKDLPVQLTYGDTYIVGNISEGLVDVKIIYLYLMKIDVNGIYSENIINI